MPPLNKPVPGSVLIVDDVPENLSMLSDALDEAGYMVLVATDGHTALDRLRHISPDVILLDAKMPGMDGFETCRQIRTNPDTSEIPVIFMTGLTESEHVVRGFEVGGTDYVTKPIKPNEVIARVAAHTRNARRISHASEAIDAAGLAIVILNPDLTAEWMSPGAAALLGSDAGGEDKPALPQALRSWLASAAALSSSGESAGAFDFEHGGLALRARLPGKNMSAEPKTDEAITGETSQSERNSFESGQGQGGGTRLLLLEKQSAATAVTPPLSSYHLTQREAEVLTWVARGKTNKDIADILGLSPRTVNKHLEHVYVKLGVETRTAAAAFVTTEPGISPRGD